MVNQLIKIDHVLTTYDQLVEKSFMMTITQELSTKKRTKIVKPSVAKNHAAL